VFRAVREEKRRAAREEVLRAAREEVLSAAREEVLSAAREEVLRAVREEIQSCPRDTFAPNGTVRHSSPGVYREKGWRGLCQPQSWTWPRLILACSSRTESCPLSCKVCSVPFRDYSNFFKFLSEFYI
jgi:hypothetical protein